VENQETDKKLNTAYPLKYQMGSFINMLKLVESKKFTSSLLIDVQKRLTQNNTLPSEQFKKLSTICGNISNRNYMLLQDFTGCIQNPECHLSDKSPRN
jgi:hypothetical protein